MRMKIVAGNVIAVLLVGLVSYVMVKSNVEAELVSEVDSRITNDFRLLDRSFRLSARDLLGFVELQADQRPMGDVFGALDETGRRTRAFDQTERVATWLTDPARRGSAPDIVVVTDDTGRVVARSADRNAMYGVDIARAVPAVGAALRGESGTDVWQKEDEHKVLQVAVAPIRNSEGRIVGALLVGYDLSNGVANAEGDILGREVAFVLSDSIYSSSFDQAGVADSLRGFLFSAGQASMTGALTQASTSAPFVVDLADEQYVGVVGPVPGARSIAMVVLASRTDQLAKASSTSFILVLMAVGLLIVLAYGFLVGSSFIKPIEQMEEGVLAVINGRTDLRLDIQSTEYGGLAYRINQLLNVFTGTPEEDESGRVSSPPAARWGDESMAASSVQSPDAAAASEGSGGAAGGADAAEAPEDPEVVAKLAAEPEDAYYARVYQEYVAAKQAVGENVSNIPQDKFVQRLRANEAGLVKKHGCRMVRFLVQTRGTQVNLKPVVIR